MNLPEPDFDAIARAYRWLEYGFLGRLLERTRECHLACLSECRQALVLGDGDGRFTARLLVAAPKVRVEAVDLSSAMLALLQQCCTVSQDRLRTCRQDARTYTPDSEADLVVTHFFLDCLTQQEVEVLVARLTPQLAANALWLVSEFRIPSGALRWPAWLYVRTLYVAFRLLTGLRITCLPNHAPALERCGYARVAVRQHLFGMLTSELWQRI